MMKKFKYVIYISFFFYVTQSSLIALAAQNNTEIIHEILGEVVDADENLKYNIFGDIDGFSAARLQKKDNNFYKLYLIRNSEQGAQIFVQDIAKPVLLQLRSRIDERVKSLQEQQHLFETSLMPVHESLWEKEIVDSKIILKDGSRLHGSLKRAKIDTLVFQTKSGANIKVRVDNIAHISKMRGEISSEKFYRIDPNSSRMFFAPTGRQLNAGSGYFADYWIFFPTIAFGITDFFSFAGGVSILPAAESQIVYLAPKLTLKLSQKSGVAAGVLHLTVPDEEDRATLGYVVTTFGDATGGVTFGGGMPLGPESSSHPVWVIGGEIQASNSSKFITENWIFTGKDSFTLFSGGIRFFGDRLAVDLALFTTSAFWKAGGFPFLPWVDFSFFWGE